MSADVVALLGGTILAVGALAFVLHPLFFGVSATSAPRAARHAAPDESAIRALREIEFDRATGKLSDSDYAELRKSYGEKALRELRAAGAPATVPATAPPADADVIEARVRAYRLARRECERCGLRSEQDAIYCSTCGGYLARVCPACSAPITESGAAFCSTCGESLAAPGIQFAGH